MNANRMNADRINDNLNDQLNALIDSAHHYAKKCNDAIKVACREYRQINTEGITNELSNIAHFATLRISHEILDDCIKISNLFKTLNNYALENLNADIISYDSNIIPITLRNYHLCQYAQNSIHSVINTPGTSPADFAYNLALAYVILHTLSSNTNNINMYVENVEQERINIYNTIKSLTSAPTNDQLDDYNRSIFIVDAAKTISNIIKDLNSANANIDAMIEGEKAIAKDITSTNTRNTMRVPFGKLRNSGINASSHSGGVHKKTIKNKKAVKKVTKKITKKATKKSARK